MIACLVDLRLLMAGHEFYKNLQRLSIYLRWLACSVLPDVYDALKGMPDKRHPGASTLFYLYAAVEDCILQAWEGAARELRPKHMSLHFDGMRLGGLESNKSSAAFPGKNQACHWFPCGHCGENLCLFFCVLHGGSLRRRSRSSG